MNGEIRKREKSWMICHGLCCHEHYAVAWVVPVLSKQPCWQVTGWHTIPPSVQGDVMCTACPCGHVSFNFLSFEHTKKPWQIVRRGIWCKGAERCPSFALGYAPRSYQYRWMPSQLPSLPHPWLPETWDTPLLTSSLCVPFCLVFSSVTHMLRVSGLCSPLFVSWVSIYPFHLLMDVRGYFLFVDIGLRIVLIWAVVCMHLVSEPLFIFIDCRFVSSWRCCWG